MYSKYKYSHVWWYLFAITFISILLPTAKASNEKTDRLFYDNFKLVGATGWHRNNNAIENSNIAILVHEIDPKHDISGLSIDLKEKTASSVSWVSKRFSLNDAKHLVAEAVVSTKNVQGGIKTWHRAAVTLQFFDSNDKYINHSDIVRISGTHNREVFKHNIITPVNAFYARVIFGMVGSTGVSVLHGISIDSNKLSGNVSAFDVMPKPWKMNCTNENLKIDNINIYFEQESISKRFKQSAVVILAEAVGRKQTQLVYEDNKDELPVLHIRKLTLNQVEALALENSDDDITELTKNDGYRIHFVNDNNKTDIVVESRTERGLYYAIQTLVQLITTVNSKIHIQICDIKDWPVLEMRGIATGKSNSKYIKKLSKYKINEIQISGSAGFWGEWNKPITPSLARKIDKLGNNIQNHFINGTVLSWPGAYGEIFSWSSNSDRQIIADKAILYAKSGFTGFLLVGASDYARVGRGNGVISTSDIDKGLSLSEAHITMLEHLCSSLSQANSSMRLHMFPYYYMGAREYSDKEISYLSDISGLNDSIYLYYGGRTSYEDIKSITKYIGRKPVVRISAPGSVGMVREISGDELSQLLMARFIDVPPYAISGLVVEAPKSDDDIKYIANILWNYGREQ